MKRKFAIKILIIVLFFSIILLASSLSWVYFSTKSNIYQDPTYLPYNKVGLIPGCNKYISKGVINKFYQERIYAGVMLFNSGKIDYILVSGDNAHASYDEPREMKNSLIDAGIPKEKIYSDYAGFRTLDTIVRAKEVFQLERVTFISQSFQNQRGVFIGNHKGIQVKAFNAGEPGVKYSIKTNTREMFAKIKMLIDLFITGKDPKFLGDKIPIESTKG